tara:strand:- start:414 stop:623 length:210 start_codon:yes stop_codon:yes gene_type:complete
MKKRPYLRVKYKELKNITEKAILVTCFDGSSAILPKSYVQHHGLNDILYVPTWLAEKKPLQYANKKEWR